MLTDQPFPGSNDELVHSISSYTRDVVASLDGLRGALYVETAGGKLKR
jgi:dethiobiotin synthetase/adenosylmethionine--8-amino-7-oxononanoate aminotransferase